ncbi:hypothetical protein M5689_009897 [Euphorbia peplus]|nr:hypothetical protein M5689_009897 [Euphorbia peplus]
MVNIRGAVEKARAKVNNGKGEVGEIDTRAPIKSVKAAVTLYVEAVSKDKDNDTSSIPTKKSKLDIENVINKEAKLVLFQKAVESYKQLSQTDEKALARAQSELTKAKKTLNELLSNLKAAKDSKLMAIEAAHFVEKQAKELEFSKPEHHLLDLNAHREQELDQEKEQYTLVFNLLDVSKQELTRIRQDFEAAQESKEDSIQEAEEAESLLSMNQEKIDEMSREIQEMSDSSQELGNSLARIQDEISEILREKDENAESCKRTKEELEKKIDSLRQECSEMNIHDLEVKLEETNMEIESLQEKMRKNYALEMDTLTDLTGEINEATRTLKGLVVEEDSLRREVSSLRLELENVKKERHELETKQDDHETKEEQEEVVLLCKEHRIMHKQLSERTERKRQEIQDIKKTVDKLKNEAENAKVMVEGIKSKLEEALKNAEEAKSAKSKVYNELTEKQSDSPNVNSKSIKISAKEYEELKQILEENEELAQRKEEEARTAVEAINSSRSEIEEKLSEQLQSLDEIGQAIEIALKSAQTAESAQHALQAELTKLQQEEEMVCPN